MRAALVAVIAAAVAGWAREGALPQRPADPRADISLPDVPSEVARPLSFGFASLAADYAFLEAIQVHGGRPKSDLTLAAGAPQDRLLARLLTYATDMDPKFRGAYRFSGTSLPRHTSDGKAANIFSAEQLLKKGVVERPDDWEIAFYLGFLESFYLGKMSDAAHAMALAAHAPGAPKYVGFLATRLAADAGNLEMGEKLAAVMEAQSTEDATREEWHRRLLDLQMERHLREIEAAADRFRARTGREPASVNELVAAHDLPAVPPEPHGGQYQLTPEGEARSTAAPRLRVRGRSGTQSGLVPQ